MKLPLLSLALTAVSVGATVPLSSVQRTTTSPNNALAGEYIVEMNNVQGLGGKRAYASTHDTLYRSLRKRGISFDVKKEYNQPGIMVGAALKVASPQDVQQIATMAEVKAIRPVIAVPAPERINQFTVSSPNDSRITADSETTHIMTGVDKVHAAGITGEGIKIGIIDTGIDYNHPLLGAGFGPGFKVIGGYDFVGDDYTGSNNPAPDDDPLDNCNGHGTHVAGIIGANPGNDFGISGVAYGSSIASYRVFGCSGFVSDDIIIDALLRGYSDGMDILTLSLGGVEGWTESSSSVVASRIADQGRVVTIAAGNDGAYGSWYASSPGTGVDVISVASVNNIAIPVQNATVQGVEHAPIPYLEALPLNVTGSRPIYATSTDTTVADDACNALPNDTPDLSGYVVVIKRGTCTFVTKLQNAAAKGANTFLIYNNGGSFSAISVGDYTAALISETDGTFLVNQFAAKANITISFPQSGSAWNYPDDVSGGLVSDFSSYGPSYDMYFKPAVAAPGGNILSTLPIALGSYGVESGTSMATPFTAGSAALILQAKGKSVAKSIRNLFQTTASAVASSKTDGDPLQTVSQQGAGLIQVDRAIGTTTVVSPGQLTLNDTAHFEGFKTFNIQNTGSKAVTYKISHVPAGTAASVQSGSIFAADGPVPLTADYAQVTFSLNKVTVLPGVSVPILVWFKPPQGVDASTYPVYSGFIEIAGLGETLRVAYLGVAASLKDKAVVDNTDEYFGVKIPALLDASGDVQGNSTNYTLVGDDVPSLLYRFAFGSAHVRVDLVEKASTVSATLSKRNWWNWWWPQKPSNSYDKVPIVGTLAEYDYVPRNSDASTIDDNGYNVFQFTDSFVNGTKIAAGEYKVLLRALKVTGNPAEEGDYETWLSPSFSVVPA
ncbi:subtilisin-like protease [Gloeophyllum trabeum ATCC 11539]|uniref:Subtilisin-like protease n=1 Tax=Gloeophyllum trabeum (strain ATCC 11539 / FP-39264 / Madison 617) TaxID=670483 RepID=S7RRI5_GLOTA|nr:subtilisin-like protease [Gloeophyllum trabeum ATCC 11539]EPQ55564.1 subtilisin-like protease [Gloeophyllum trabeum ATCC 11539]